MNLLSLLSKYPRPATAIVGTVVVLWFLSTTAPLLVLQVCLVASVLAYLSGRAVLARMLARPPDEKAALSRPLRAGLIGAAIGASIPQVEKSAPSRSLRAGAIGAAVGASVLAIGAALIMPGTLSGFFHSAAASSAEVSSKIDGASTSTQTTVSFAPPAAPLASSLGIDVSLLVVLVMALLVGHSHLISAAGKLRDRLKNSTRSPNGPAILGLLALAVVAQSGSRTLNAPATPVVSKAVDQRTNAEKRTALEGQLAEKLTALRQLETTLQGATSTSAISTKALDDMSLWRNTSRPNPAEMETLRSDINKIVKELGGLGS